MLTVIWDFTIQVLQWFTVLFKEIAIERSFTWNIPFVYTGIPVYDPIEELWLFPSNIFGFPYNLYPDGWVPDTALSGQSPLWTIQSSITGNFLSIGLWVISSVFLAVVIWSVIKKWVTN